MDSHWPRGTHIHRGQQKVDRYNALVPDRTCVPRQSDIVTAYAVGYIGNWV